MEESTYFSKSFKIPWYGITLNNALKNTISFENTSQPRFHARSSYYFELKVTKNTTKSIYMLSIKNNLNEKIIKLNDQFDILKKNIKKHWYNSGIIFGVLLVASIITLLPLPFILYQFYKRKNAEASLNKLFKVEKIILEQFPNYNFINKNIILTDVTFFSPTGTYRTPKNVTDIEGPISLEALTDPVAVLIKDEKEIKPGTIYNRKHINNWIIEAKKNNETPLCPITREEIWGIVDVPEVKATVITYLKSTEINKKADERNVSSSNNFSY